MLPHIAHSIEFIRISSRSIWLCLPHYFPNRYMYELMNEHWTLNTDYVLHRLRAFGVWQFWNHGSKKPLITWIFGFSKLFPSKFSKITFPPKKFIFKHITIITQFFSWFFYSLILFIFLMLFFITFCDCRWLIFIYHIYIERRRNGVKQVLCLHMYRA